MKTFFQLFLCLLSISSFAANLRPYAEYESADYLMMTDPFIELVPFLRTLPEPDHSFEDHDRGSFEMKTQIIKNLPQNVTLVILYIDNSSAHKLKLEQYLKAHLGSKWSKKVKLLFKEEVTTGRESLGLFWARDSFPIALKSSQDGFVLADTRFQKRFKYAEPDAVVSEFLKVPLTDATESKLEGGNFIATAKGICFSVKNEHTTEEFFKSSFGCKEVHLLPKVGGIVNIDERLKILSNRKILTDSVEYQEILMGLGFEVTLLPKATGGEWRTYLNSLLINKTIFVPTFGSAESDKKVLNIYKSFKLNVVPVDSRFLSDQGAGSIHCFTATYPKQ